MCTQRLLWVVGDKANQQQNSKTKTKTKVVLNLVKVSEAKAELISGVQKKQDAGSAVGFLIRSLHSHVVPFPS